jgi:hypothetical protein
VTDPQPIDEDLLRIAGNPKVADAVKESLRQLSKGTAGKDLAEMAKELLAGRTTLREIGQSEAYATHLNTAMAKFQQWQSALTPEERNELEQRTRDELGPTVTGE